MALVVFSIRLTQLPWIRSIHSYPGFTLFLSSEKNITFLEMPLQKEKLIRRLWENSRLITRPHSDPDHLHLYPPATGITNPLYWPLIYRSTCIQKASSKHKLSHKKGQSLTFHNQMHPETEMKNTWDITQQSSWVFTVGVCAISKQET